MNLTLKSAPISKEKSDCLILACFAKDELSKSAAELNKISKGSLLKMLKNADFTGKIAQTLFLYDLPNIAAKRLLIIGCGEQKKLLSVADFRKIVGGAIKTLSATECQTAVSYLSELKVAEHDSAWMIKQMAEVSLCQLYRFDQFKSKKEPAPKLKKLEFNISGTITKPYSQALQQGISIAAGSTFTKNLANMPSNICTPSYLAQQAQKLASDHKAVKVKVLDEKAMKKLGMGLILAVSQGSAEGAKLICLEYNGGKKQQAPVAIVGKGITFDTGGLSLKPADAMVGMKYDMCGAATVLGTIKAVAELKLPINVVGIIASAENMPSGTAIKPEDIVTSMSGQTVEIMNTDAEGRLVLADALTYCERYKPDAVIDIATLTGAVVIALGFHATGLLSNHDPLSRELEAAGKQSHDRVWPLPLWDEFQEQLKSPFADMSNTGGRAGGTITAACFLSRYAKKFHWAHLDVAGTAAMMGGNDRYATGRPVPLLVQFLLNRCKL